jgi:hypothetical protein
MIARLLLLTGQALDAATFALFFALVPPAILVQLGVAEQNPIIAALFAIGGFTAVVIVKLGATGFVLYRDQKRPDRPKKTTFFMGAAATSGFVGATFNTIALLTILGVLA